MIPAPGGAVTVKWTVMQTSAPNITDVVISNINILNPMVTIPDSATVVLQLTATSVGDPDITASDTMEIQR